jgi:hypothetical protein
LDNFHQFSVVGDDIVPDLVGIDALIDLREEIGQVLGRPCNSAEQSLFQRRIALVIRRQRPTQPSVIHK